MSAMQNAIKSSVTWRVKGLWPEMSVKERLKNKLFIINVV